MSSQATYQHRKGPNVSQFIASLNAMPSTAEDPNSKNDPNAQTDGFGVGDDDLDLFMHTEFLQDFDDDFSNPLGHTLDDSPIDFDPGRPLHQSSTPSNLAADASAPAATAATLGGGPTATSNANTDMKTNLNFEDDFQFNGLTYLPTNHAQLQGPPIQNYGSPTAQDFDLTFSPTSPYGVPSVGKSSVTPSPPNGKRIAATDPAALEANSRAAAEEDKRRRNTAASARFRIKKKQREQALEKTAKDMTDKVEQLEKRVDQLEMENKWLKGLVVEKTAKGGEEVAELWKRFKEEDEKRSSKTAKKGVGTAEE